MQLDITAAANDESLLCVGGEWDRRLRRYVGEAQQSRVLSVHPGQVEALEAFADWLDDHAAGRTRPPDEQLFSILLTGGQRAGKTALGVWLAIAYAVACPGSIVWIVGATDRDYDEVIDYLNRAMPRAWYVYRGSPKFCYQLANGSRINLRSAHIPEALKKGRADLIVLNEAQRMAQAAYAIARARTADKGGLLIGCANPPDKPIGDWVTDWAVEAEAGLRHSLAFYLNPYENPHINHPSIASMAEELDERTYESVVLGKHVSMIDRVLYNWSATENERRQPDPELDITRDFLRWKEGREYVRAVGVDVQKVPMVAAEYKFFINPLATGEDVRLPWCHSWITSEVVLEGASEEDLAMAWLEAGWNPEETLIVCDASGEFQFATRKPDEVAALRKKVRGRGSFDVFRSFGFRHIVKPDRNMERNPDVLERCRATTSRICTKVAGQYGQRFLFADPRCRKVIRSIRKWENKHGQPSRTSQHSHFGDIVSYPIHRFFPRQRPTPDPEIKVVSRLQGRNRMRGW